MQRQSTLASLEAELEVIEENKGYIYINNQGGFLEVKENVTAEDRGDVTSNFDSENPYTERSNHYRTKRP